MTAGATGGVGRRWRAALARVSLPLAALSWTLATDHALARWPSAPESDGVYGRFGGDTDLSLKLGGHLSERRVAGSLGASVHYYSSIGVSFDYVESLADDALDLRGLSIGTELRPLFLPRFLLGRQTGPAWLDLTLDSIALGFGAYWSKTEEPLRDARGVWVSGGVGVPLSGHSSGPWLELRALRRFPDPQLPRSAHNALFVYVSWHHFAQLGSAE